MTSVIQTLRELPKSDLEELLAVISDQSCFGETLGSTPLVERVLTELRTLCCVEEIDDHRLERHLVRRLANGLHIDYHPDMDVPEITGLIRDFISDAIVEDLRPFIQVAVCMGWADGCLLPEEIAVMDAALSRLKLISRRRSELLALCGSPVAPDHLAEILSRAASDDQKAWSLLALGWAVALVDMRTHPQEIRAFNTLAHHLGIDRARADQLRDLVTRRFHDGLDGPGPNGTGAVNVPGGLAMATMSAIQAAEMDSYLQAKIGLKTLGLLLSSRVSVSDTTDRLATLDELLDSQGWIGAPAVLAGALFLRRMEHDPTMQRLLVTVLLCLERGR